MDTTNDTTTTATAAEQSGPDTTGEEDKQQAKESMSAQDYQKALESARREAARYRTERNQLRQVAEQAQAVAKEKLTAEERLAALEQELQQARLSKQRADIAREVGVPEALVVGESSEQMREVASSLAALVAERVEAAIEQERARIPHAPRVPGENTGSAAAGDGQDWLRSRLLGK